MQHVAVTSSNVKSVGYDAATQQMEVAFKDKADASKCTIYVYRSVPPEAHQALVSAESVGAHFAKHVRGKFEFEKLPEGTTRETIAPLAWRLSAIQALQKGEVCLRHPNGDPSEIHILEPADLAVILADDKRRAAASELGYNAVTLARLTAIAFNAEGVGHLEHFGLKLCSCQKDIADESGRCAHCRNAAPVAL